MRWQHRCCKRIPWTAEETQATQTFVAAGDRGALLAGADVFQAHKMLCVKQMHHSICQYSLTTAL